LPILELPFHYTLAQISNEINNGIFKRLDNKLQQLITAHNALMQCALKGQGLEAVAELLCDFIRNPIIVLDSKWRLLAYAEHPLNKEKLSDHLELNIKERVFSEKFMKEIPNNIEEFTKSIKRRFPDSEGQIVCRILPVAADKVIYGYLIVWETVSKMTNMEYMALESASTIVAIERVKIKQIEEIRHQQRRDFFDDLLDGKIESVNAVNGLAEIHGLDASKKYNCMVININSRSKSKEHLAPVAEKDEYWHFKDRLIGIIDTVSYENKQKVVSIHRGNLIISFILIKEADINKKSRAVLDNFISSIYRSLCKADPELNITIGIGNPCTEFLELKKSFKQAQETIRIATMIDKGKHISYYEDILIYQLLNSIGSKEKLKEFYSSTVGKLYLYDSRNNTNFVETLEQYFYCNGNISTAAQKMFMHRNTMIYRIEKIKGILDSELKDPEEILEIQTGLHIAKILKD